MDSDIAKMLERKANFVDVQEALAGKADARELNKFITKTDA